MRWRYAADLAYRFRGGDGPMETPASCSRAYLNASAMPVGAASAAPAALLIPPACPLRRIPGDVGGQAGSGTDRQSGPGQPAGPAAGSPVREQDQRVDDLGAVDRQWEGVGVPGANQDARLGSRVRAGAMVARRPVALSAAGWVVCRGGAPIVARCYAHDSEDVSRAGTWFRWVASVFVGLRVGFATRRHQDQEWLSPSCRS